MKWGRGARGGWKLNRNRQARRGYERKARNSVTLTQDSSLSMFLEPLGNTSRRLDGGGRGIWVFSSLLSA